MSALNTVRWRRFGFLVAVCGIAVLGFALGSRYYSSSMSAYRELRASFKAIDAENAEAQQQLVNLDLADKVNRLTQEKLRQKVTELQTELAKLESELILYKNLVEDNEADPGLNLESVSLRTTDEPRRFEYRIVVRRKAALSQSVDASVSLSIDGKLLGIPYSVPFNEADLSLHEDALNIRFKYFKVLRGTFVLPEHFTPEKIFFSMYETGRADSLVIKEMPWKVEDY